jgi:hypothetical protein
MRSRLGPPPQSYHGHVPSGRALRRAALRVLVAAAGVKDRTRIRGLKAHRPDGYDGRRPPVKVLRKLKARTRP